MNKVTDPQPQNTTGPEDQVDGYWENGRYIGTINWGGTFQPPRTFSVSEAEWESMINGLTDEELASLGLTREQALKFPPSETVLRQLLGAGFIEIDGGFPSTNGTPTQHGRLSSPGRSSQNAAPDNVDEASTYQVYVDDPDSPDNVRDVVYMDPDGDGEYNWYIEDGKGGYQEVEITEDENGALVFTYSLGGKTYTGRLATPDELERDNIYDAGVLSANLDPNQGYPSRPVDTSSYNFHHTGGYPPGIYFYYDKESGKWLGVGIGIDENGMPIEGTTYEVTGVHPDGKHNYKPVGAGDDQIQTTHPHWLSPGVDGQLSSFTYDSVTLDKYTHNTPERGVPVSDSAGKQGSLYYDHDLDCWVVVSGTWDESDNFTSSQPPNVQVVNYTTPDTGDGSTNPSVNTGGTLWEFGVDSARTDQETFDELWASWSEDDATENIVFESGDSVKVESPTGEYQGNGEFMNKLTQKFLGKDWNELTPEEKRKFIEIMIEMGIISDVEHNTIKDQYGNKTSQYVLTLTDSGQELVDSLP